MEGRLHQLTASPTDSGLGSESALSVTLAGGLGWVGGMWGGQWMTFDSWVG